MPAYRPRCGVFTEGDEAKKVWFYDIQADGFSLDDKRNEIPDNDADCVAKYREFV